MAHVKLAKRCAQGAVGDAKVSGDEAAEFTVVRDGVASAADAATAGQEDEVNGDGAELLTGVVSNSLVFAGCKLQ